MSRLDRCKQCNKQALRIKGIMNFCSDDCKASYNKAAALRPRSRRVLSTEVPSIDQIQFYGYKEPLTKIKDGYGYYGVVAYSLDNKTIQCHICGKLYRSLSNHVQMHDLTIMEYKDKFQLARTTALIGEETREALIKAYVNHGRKIAQLRAVDQASVKQKLAESNISRTGIKLPLEIRNKRGNCPDQLLDKIKKLRDKLGRTPSVKDFKREYDEKHTGTIYYTFGSWSNACKLAGMTSLKDTRAEHHSNDNLLEYLRIFYKEHGRVPKESDMRRGLLPSRTAYRRRWGTLNYARMAAGIPIVIPVSGRRHVETMDYTKLSLMPSDASLESEKPEFTPLTELSVSSLLV